MRQKKKTEDAKRIRGIVRENDKNKGLSHVQNEMGRLMHHDEQELLSVWEGWHRDDNKGGGSIRVVRQGETRRSGVHPSPQDVHKGLQGNLLT